MAGVKTYAVKDLGLVPEVEDQCGYSLGCEAENGER